ncbi:NFACT family protein [Lachnospiraceae bacterium ZAX-1]
MAFDGIVIANLVKELNEHILNGRISKIAQPEKDELLLTIKGHSGQTRLVLSASASLPLIYLTSVNKQSPKMAPNFCMLLRKHIANGRITAIDQPHMERIINFEIEHLDELGDLRKKTLVVEVMGKHSNIIFCKEDGTVIDSIKHVSALVSSVREVLPGRAYFIPDTLEKRNPLTTNEETFITLVCTKPVSILKAIYNSYTGISPLIASELCYRASIDADIPCAGLSENEKLHLFHHFSWLMDDIKEGKFNPTIISRGKEPIEFSSILLSQYQDFTTEAPSTGISASNASGAGISSMEASSTGISASNTSEAGISSMETSNVKIFHIEEFDTISQVLEQYYASKNIYTRIRQKSVDLRKVIATVLERNRKKYALQAKQLKDTEKKDIFKVYGELIHTYGHGILNGSKQMEALNYYTNETITIPLDPLLSPKENAKKYFDKYNKMKRTFEALSQWIEDTKSEILHLESISTSLDIAVSEDDLAQIKEELMEYGYIKKRNVGKKVKIKSRPFHYISSDGYHIYIGKNNFQNDELTFKFAVGNDWWFHAKGIPGSHVLVKSGGEQLPDRTFEEAGRLAAYYSKGRTNEKVEIDYLERKNVKKPNGSKPGFVVYYTNYSLMIEPDITGIEQLDVTIQQPQ